MMIRHLGMPMFGGMKVQNPMQNQGGPIQEPPMATFPGTADASTDMGMGQVRAPFNRGPVMGGGFMGGFGGGFGNWGGGFSRPLFPQFGGGFMGGGFSPFGNQFGGGFSPSRQMMGNYMGNLMQPFSFGFQPPRTQQAPQPQPQMPGANVPPPMTPDIHSLFGNN